MLSNLPPFLPFLVGALIVPFVRGVPRQVLLLLVPIVGAMNVWGLQEGFHHAGFEVWDEDDLDRSIARVRW